MHRSIDHHETSTKGRLQNRFEDHSRIQYRSPSLYAMNLGVPYIFDWPDAMPLVAQYSDQEASSHSCKLRVSPCSTLPGGPTSDWLPASEEIGQRYSNTSIYPSINISSGFTCPFFLHSAPAAALMVMELHSTFLLTAPSLEAPTVHLRSHPDSRYVCSLVISPPSPALISSPYVWVWYGPLSSRLRLPLPPRSTAALTPPSLACPHYLPSQ